MSTKNTSRKRAVCGPNSPICRAKKPIYPPLWANLPRAFLSVPPCLCGSLPCSPWTLRPKDPMTQRPTPWLPFPPLDAYGSMVDFTNAKRVAVTSVVTLRSRKGANFRKKGSTAKSPLSKAPLNLRRIAKGRGMIAELKAKSANLHRQISRVAKLSLTRRLTTEAPLPIVQKP